MYVFLRAKNAQNIARAPQFRDNAPMAIRDILSSYWLPDTPPGGAERISAYASAEAMDL